jgi:hypothetical protein
MKGALVKWVHNDWTENICVVIKEYLEEEIDYLIGYDQEIEDAALYLVYDFMTDTYFYALAEELEFICHQKKQ